MFIGRENNLLIIFVEGVESVEKFFLDFFHLTDELNIVNYEEIILTVLFLEGIRLIVLECVDKISREFLQRKIMHLFVRIFLLDGVPNRLNQVSFTQASAAIDKKRVILRSRTLNNSLGSCISKFVKGPNNERVEMVAWV